ncbi:MAG: glycosyltransferase family 2 protein [Pseudomonadales bacterium]
MFLEYTLTVIVPAHDEAEAIGTVVGELLALRHSGEPLVDRVVVAANACTDDTAAVAAAAGAVVVEEARKGYGAACLAALTVAASADLIAFVDGDDSCEVSALLTLVERWHQGADLVIGSRALGVAEAGALPPHQRWGNRFAGFVLTRLSGQRVTDLGPLRLIAQRTLQRLNMQDQAFGWTVEMQIKALREGLVVAEVPVASRRRTGHSKVSGTLRGSLGASWTILRLLARYALGKDRR